MMSRRFAGPLIFLAAACSGGASDANPDASAAPGSSAVALAVAPAPAPAQAESDGSLSSAEPPSATTHAARAANEYGYIPILEYHLLGDSEGRWQRERGRFRRDLEMLYARGYRPVSVADLVDRKLNLPAGTSPVVFTFDDASPSQFRYLEHADGTLEIDSTSAVGIWLAFSREHPDWGKRATFCLLSGAEAGRSFFGNRNIEGQKTEWRFQKVRFLADQGFELCDHTLWHANLGKYDDAVVQEQIARGVMAIDSAVPGYRVRTLALPLGVWPKNRDLAVKGAWRDPRSGRVVSYDFDAVLEVAGTVVPSPHSPAFNPLKLERVQVLGDALDKLLDRLDASGKRYVSDGTARVVGEPPMSGGGGSGTTH